MSLKKLWPTYTWAIAILLLVGLPGSYFPSVQTFWDWLSPDKIVHIVVFGIQAILPMYAYDVILLQKKRRYIVTTTIIILTTVYALLTEVLQLYVFIGRHGSLYDFVADFVGVIVGIVAYYLLNLKKKKVGYN